MRVPCGVPLVVPPQCDRGQHGVALIMVLVVLSALAVIGAPFVLSMLLHDAASRNFAGEVAARNAATAARNHAVARLEHTSRPAEYAREEIALEPERPRVSTTRLSGGPSRRRAASPRRQGVVIRRDLGEGSGRSRRTSRDARRDGGVPEALRTSAHGPSPREVDTEDELATELPASVGIPRSAMRSRDGRPAPTEDGPLEVRFHGSRGITTSADVQDEQGKINVNTAPPVLIANLFGVTQLARPLKRNETTVVVDDPSAFRGDDDPESIDGALVLVHPRTGTVEAVTYRRKEGHAFHDCFRGDFLSLVLEDEFPVGAFVYDLRGWKIGLHRLWSRRLGGFHPAELTEFRSVEAIREIAGWQIASFFLSRFRGEGLTLQFLKDNGIQPRDLEKLGLDPVLFSDDAGREPENRAEYERVRRTLRRRGFSSRLVARIEARRGPRVVEEIAARLDGASRAEARKLAEELEATLDADRRRSPAIPRGELKRSLEQLARLYERPGTGGRQRGAAFAVDGIETILAADLERYRRMLTASSAIAARWSEAQPILSAIRPIDTAAQARVPRASEFNPGTIVRLRTHGAGRGEFNSVAAAQGAAEGGVTLDYPVRRAYDEYGATIQALGRHPVNVNTASTEVLRAVFTGVRAARSPPDAVVTPYEAARLAERVLRSRPLEGHEDFHRLLTSAVSADVIDDEDVIPLLVNAIQPTSYLLSVSTTGLWYATGDVYTIESRGILRTSSGREVAKAGFREILEVSPAGTLHTGLLTQRDLADGIFLRDPWLSAGFPEHHHQYLLAFAGVRSHLVASRPLLLHRVAQIFPGGDVGSLRLVAAETPETRSRFTVGEIYHFRETYEGLELADGEPFVVPADIGGGGAADRGGANVAPGSGVGGAGAASDLTMVPGAVEFWFRMRTPPSARSRDGLVKLMEASAELDRNYLQLLYDDRRQRVVLRLAGSSQVDPSVLRNELTGQYLELEAYRALDLDTWYHLRVAWDGVFGGGAQLFIDGIPAGKDNLSTELVSAIPASGQITAIAVRDAARFPRAGAVRIDGEIFEYERSGNTLKVRREPRSSWRPLPPPPVYSSTPRSGPGPGQGPGPAGPGGPAGAPAPAQPAAPRPPASAGAQAPGSDVMRSPWNRRGANPSVHAPGARVVLHGYSLEIRRKLDLPQGGWVQVGDGDGSVMVWGPGGLSSLERLPAFNLPPDVLSVAHYVDLGLLADPAGEGPPGGGPAPGAPPGGGPRLAEVPRGRNLPPEGGPGRPGPGSGADPAQTGNYVVPHFQLPYPPAYTPDYLLSGRRLSRFAYTAVDEQFSFNAADYFQSRGVVQIGGTRYLYEKTPLPPDYVRAQNEDPAVLQAQLTGLRLVAEYTGSSGAGARPGAAPPAPAPGASGPAPGAAGAFNIPLDAPLLQLSLRANGRIEGRYPPMGVLEVRGEPNPWEGRPSLLTQPLFGNHPDDVVEWLRYHSIHEDLFVGPSGSRAGNGRYLESTFRGYPVRDMLLARQLTLPPGAAIRLVMELSEGGAGYGDYVTITTGTPSIHEPAVRRVFKVLERNDGRFFVSLVPVDANGMEQAGPAPYQHTYYRAMNPRLVKFPSWGLPEIGSGSFTFFGDSQLAGPSGARAGTRSTSARTNLGGVRYREEDDPTGITIDEIRRLRNTTIPYSPVYGPRLRHVLVPLEGSRVRYEQGVGLTGVIPPERSITPSSPLDVLVVSVSTERGSPTLFARGLEDGVLRAGEELFYFSANEGDEGGGARAGQARYDAGTTAAQTATPSPAGTTGTVTTNAHPGSRDPADRLRLTPVGVSGAQGHFEPSGFARISGRNEVANFFEIFYYVSLGGQSLRGQFGTPILDYEGQTNQNGSTIHNVTRRVRLTGRALLGTQPRAHGFGEPVELVPYVQMSRITSTLTRTGLAVERAEQFSSVGGYVLIDPGYIGRGQPWEIVAHLGREGGGMLRRPRDERGRGCLRASFGTQLRPVSSEMFAYEMPFRYYDRYESEVESEALAYLAKTFRVPRAYWRTIEWRERPWLRGRERLADIVVLARFDGAPEWDAEPTNHPGGLYFLEDRGRRSGEAARFHLDNVADELEIRVYFRYRSGAYLRLRDDLFNDDWKETPVLDSLTVEYEKDNLVLRHEELPF